MSKNLRDVDLIEYPEISLALSVLETLKHVATHGWPHAVDSDGQPTQKGKRASHAIAYDPAAVSRLRIFEQELKDLAADAMDWLGDRENEVVGCEYEKSQKAADCTQGYRPCGFLTGDGRCRLGRK